MFQGSKDQMVKEASTRHETKFYELLLETGAHKVQGFWTPSRNSLTASSNLRFWRFAPRWDKDLL